MMLFLVIFLAIHQGSMDDSTMNLTEEKEALVNKILEVDNEIKFLNAERIFSKEHMTQNTLLKESVNNLFELVPDQITLNSIKLEKNMLVLKGITPSKEVYNFLMAVPLKSIFTTSEAEFYQLPNGWYNFMSVNKLLEETEVE